MRKTSSRLLVVLCVACSVQACSEPGTPDGPTKPASARVEALMRRLFKSDGPGGAVMVIQEGKVILNQGYGLANVQTKEPFTSQTVSMIGSMTKQFTAMGIMMLKEEVSPPR